MIGIISQCVRTTVNNYYFLFTDQNTQFTAIIGTKRSLRPGREICLIISDQGYVSRRQEADYSASLFSVSIQPSIILYVYSIYIIYIVFFSPIQPATTHYTGVKKISIICARITSRTRQNVHPLPLAIQAIHYIIIMIIIVYT